MRPRSSVKETPATAGAAAGSGLNETVRPWTSRRGASGMEGFHHCSVFLGSKASRTASPMKTSSDSMSAMTKKPVRPSQGA